MIESVTLQLRDYYKLKYPEILSRYPTSGNHGQEHILSCLKNLDNLTAPENHLGITEHEKLKAGLALCLHDLVQRHGSGEEKDIKEYVLLELKESTLSDIDIMDIVIAIHNHNKPKYNWKNGIYHLTSCLVYDADKMDTTKERFNLDTNPLVDVNGVNSDRFYGYVFMIRDAMTFPQAYKYVTLQLPKELQLDPIDQSLTQEEILTYYTKVHLIWERSTMPAKKNMAKYCFQTYGNKSFLDAIKKHNQFKETNLELAGVRKILINRCEYLNQQALSVVTSLDKIFEIEGVGLDFSKDILYRYLIEKLFNYDMFKIAIKTFPKEWENSLAILEYRNSDQIHENYLEFFAKISLIKNSLSIEELDKRKDYIRKIIDNKLNKLIHFTRIKDLKLLISGATVIDKDLKNIEAKLGLNSIDSIINEIITKKNYLNAIEFIKYIRGESLRAIDRVNDVFGTDRYIYFLLDGQIRQSPVHTLPFAYQLDINNLQEEEKVTLQYVSPSHPQAMKSMRLHNDVFKFPEIIQKAIRMYTNGLYNYKDYKEIFITLFALTCSEEQIDQKLFNYIFDNIIVNDDAQVQELDNGKFISADWLEVDYSDRSNPLWADANNIILRLNKLCMECEIIPPLRPYAILKDRIDLVSCNAYSYSNMMGM